MLICTLTLHAYWQNNSLSYYTIKHTTHNHAISSLETPSSKPSSIDYIFTLRTKRKLEFTDLRAQHRFAHLNTDPSCYHLILECCLRFLNCIHNPFSHQVVYDFFYYYNQAGASYIDEPVIDEEINIQDLAPNT